MIDQEDELVLELIKELVSTEKNKNNPNLTADLDIDNLIAMLGVDNFSKNYQQTTSNSLNNSEKNNTDVNYIKEKTRENTLEINEISNKQKNFKEVLNLVQKNLFEIQKNLSKVEENNQNTKTELIAKYEAQEKFLNYFLEKIQQWEADKRNNDNFSGQKLDKIIEEKYEKQEKISNYLLEKVQKWEADKMNGDDFNTEKLDKIIEKVLEEKIEQNKRIKEIEKLKQQIELKSTISIEKEESINQQIKKLEQHQQKFQTKIETFEGENTNNQKKWIENINQTFKKQFEEKNNDFQNIINELKKQIQSKNYDHLEKGLEKIKEKINQIDTNFDKNNKILEDKIAKILKNPTIQVEKEIQGIQKDVEILNSIVKSTQDFLTKNEATIQKNIIDEFEKYAHKLEEKQEVIGKITHNFESSLKQITENIIQNQSEKENILQKIQSIEKSLEQLIQDKNVSNPNLLPVLVERQMVSLIPQNTFHQYQHINELKQTMFKDEVYLQSFFPKSFWINTQNNEKTNQFYWLKEKIGLTYLGIVKCNANENSMLPIILQFIINNIVNESKLLDVESFFKELQKRIPATILNEGTNEIKCAVMVLDRINTTMYFMGVGANLWCGQKSLKKIEGTKEAFEKINFTTGKIKKHTLSAVKDTRFYVTFEEDTHFDTPIEQILSSFTNESFMRQKNIFEDFLYNQFQSENIWIGLGI